MRCSILAFGINSTLYLARSRIPNVAGFLMTVSVGYRVARLRAFGRLRLP